MKYLNRCRKAGLLIAVAALLGAGVVLANDGDIDTTYGSNGLSVTTGISIAVDIAIQSDGKAVVLVPSGNNFAALRFNTDGSPDSSFGTNGMTIVDFKSPNLIIPTQDTPHTILIDPNGAILLAGSTEPILLSHGTDFALVRLNRNGTIDKSFGKKGLVITDFSHADDVIYDLAVQDNGKILAVGKATDSGDVRFAVARYLTDGSLDPNFANNGTKSFGWGQGFNIANGVAVQDDGKIVMTGLTELNDSDGNSHAYSALARLRPGGSFDLTFSTNGKAKSAIRDANGEIIGSWAGRPVIQSDGKIVVTGFYNILQDFDVARYNTDGSLDTAFGNDGIVFPGPLVSGQELPVNRRIALDGGNIIFGGWADINGFFPACNPEIVLYRYDSSGSADPTFGINGMVEYDPFRDVNQCGKGVSAEAFALQPDGKIVTAGGSDDGNGNTGLTLARFIN